MYTDAIMPIYLVIDKSESMSWESRSKTGKRRIDVAANIIPTLLEAMQYDSTFAESVRITVLGFNNKVTEYVKQADYKALKNMWTTKASFILDDCKGLTFYGAAFMDLRKRIESDITSLINSGKKYYRPLVYFLTDGIPEGEPVSTIKEEYKKLVTNSGVKERYNPVIMCIGTGEANYSELCKYGAGRNYREQEPDLNKYCYSNKQYAWQIRKDVDEVDALTFINKMIIRTIKNSIVAVDNINGTISKDWLEYDLDGFKGKRVRDQLKRIFETEHLK